MNRRLLWGAAAALAALAVAVPALAQNRQAGEKGRDQAALDEHKAQEARERDAAAERAKRREAARSGQDPRQKAPVQQEEEEERAER